MVSCAFSLWGRCRVSGWLLLREYGMGLPERSLLGCRVPITLSSWSSFLSSILHPMGPCKNPRPCSSGPLRLVHVPTILCHILGLVRPVPTQGQALFMVCQARGCPFEHTHSFIGAPKHHLDISWDLSSGLEFQCCLPSCAMSSPGTHQTSAQKLRNQNGEWQHMLGRAETERLVWQATPGVHKPQEVCPGGLGVGAALRSSCRM